MEVGSSRDLPPITRRKTPYRGSVPSLNDETDEVLSTKFGSTDYEDAALQKPVLIVRNLCRFGHH